MQRRDLIIASGAALVTARAWSQSYPTHSVRLVVPFAPGGTTDIVARVLAEKVGGPLGQQMIVENRAGGGGVLGATDTARATPDGYSLGVATVSTVAANPSFPARDYKGFLAELKKNPGKYSYGSSGTGGIGHLQMELFKNLSGTFILHIPYRGAGPALNDTVAGQVPMIFDNLPSALPFIKDGRLVAIVVAAPQRLAVLPNVPTFKEVGLEPVNRMAFYGIYGPKGLPPEVVDKVSAAVKKTLEEPSVKKRIEDTGSLIVANSPAEFAAQMVAEFEVYKKVVKLQKLTLE
jgi:tripartite-type tricarboxylate transporter receptor subunit TctC